MTMQEDKDETNWVVCLLDWLRVSPSVSSFSLSASSWLQRICCSVELLRGEEPTVAMQGDKEKAARAEEERREQNRQDLADVRWKTASADSSADFVAEA